MTAPGTDLRSPHGYQEHRHPNKIPAVKAEQIGSAALVLVVSLPVFFIGFIALVWVTLFLIKWSWPVAIPFGLGAFYFGWILKNIFVGLFLALLTGINMIVREVRTWR